MFLFIALKFILISRKIYINFGCSDEGNFAQTLHKSVKIKNFCMQNVLSGIG